MEVPNLGKRITLGKLNMGNPKLNLELDGTFNKI